MSRFKFSLLALALVTLACSIQASGSPPEKPTATSLVAVTMTQMESANVTATRSLNVRAGPSRTYAAIGALYFGERAELTGACRNGWAKIVWKDRTAWVYSGYLSDNSCKEKRP